MSEPFAPSRLPSPEEERALVRAHLDVLVGSGFMSLADAMAMLDRLLMVQFEEAIARQRPAPAPEPASSALSELRRLTRLIEGFVGRGAA